MLTRSSRHLIAVCPILFAVVPCFATAKTLCVNPSHSHGCFGTIQAAVNMATDNDVIAVAPGTYAEDVVIGRPLSLIGSGAESTTVDATGLADGIFVDGLHHAGLHDVTIAGLTVKNAQYEGVLIVSASDVVIRDNRILNNDKVGAVFGSGPACNGQPSFETDESGDCGGGLHLIGTTHSVISGNLLSGNADGVLISDETATSRDNVLTHNTIVDNPQECGVVLASHPRAGETAPPFSAHYGVIHNTVAHNVVSRNGVTVGGAGVGVFSDGQGQGRVSGNLVIGNELTNNGIPGFSLHTHVGPSTPMASLPADDMNGNMVIGNFIAGNGPDTDDTATPGRAGINISSGFGGSPVQGTIISENVIRDEDIDVAVNTPAEVDVHLNDLLGSGIGVANVCNPKAMNCGGSVDATENFWGCDAGPGSHRCTSVSGADVRFTPWLSEPRPTDDGSGH